MKPQIYICGDSFCCIDAQWSGFSWNERLQHALGARADVITLARRCSSNFLNRLQVERAIREHADFIILSCTSSFRQEVRFRTDITANKDLFDRFIDLQREGIGSDLTTYSLLSLDSSTRLNDTQLNLLSQYHKEFFDADLEIIRNWFIIQGTLECLIKSKIPFVVSPGGFEHPSYPGSRPPNYYWNEYHEYLLDINLWDHGICRDGFTRPWFHVRDSEMLDRFASECHDNIQRRTNIT